MLLDPRGSHGQQERFLDLFFKTVLERKAEPNLKDAEVTREALTHSNLRHRRRMDIFVKTGSIALAIENKVNPREQTDQLMDYRDHLKRVSPDDYCLVFLTPGRTKTASIPEPLATQLRRDKQLIELSYAKVVDWLVECRRWCKAERIRHFLADLIHYIECNLSCNQGELEQYHE